MKSRKNLLKFQPVLFQTDCNISDLIYVFVIFGLLPPLVSRQGLGTQTRKEP